MRLALLAILVLAAMAAARADNVAGIEPGTLAGRLELAGTLVLDVRSTVEFDEGHIPGAVNIPYDTLGERLVELGPANERDIVVYCRSGRRAAIALETLEKNGFSRLFHLEGDYLRWSEEGRPVIQATARP